MELIALKRVLPFAALFLLLLLCGCESAAPRAEKYSTTYFDTFDTLITLTGYAESREAFDAADAEVKALFDRLHAVFDKYEPHDGVQGVWALNHAGGKKIEIEPELMELLTLSIERADETDYRVNIGMGAVLELWSEYREAGVALPPMEALKEADKHSSWGLIMDTEEGTAQLTDPDTRMDLGAVAKGYAVEQAAKLLKEIMPSYLIDGGGNIRMGDKPLDGRDTWTIGITDPEAALNGEQKMLMKLNLTDTSAVTSGGYQRYYTVDGEKYHHLIDPDTLMPAAYCQQVTIVTEDSGLADFLSTSAFLMPYEASRALIDGMDGVECVWVLMDGTVEMTSGIAGKIAE